MANKNLKELEQLFIALKDLQFEKILEDLKKLQLNIPSSFELARQLVQATATVVIDRNIADGEAYIKYLNHTLPYITPSLATLTVKEVRERCRSSHRSVQFWMGLSDRLAQCAKILEYWEKVETIIKLAKSITTLFKLKTVPVSTNDEIQKARDLMKNIEISHEKMSALLDVLKVFNKLSPKLLRKYIEATMSAFQNIRKIMNTCKEHSEKILKLLDEIDRLEEAARDNPNSKKRWDDRIEHDPDWFDKK